MQRAFLIALFSTTCLIACSKTEEATKDAGTAVGQAVDTAQSAAAGIGHAMASDTQSAVSAVVDTAQSAATSVVDTAQSAATTTTDTMDKAVEATRDAAHEVKEAAKAVGKDVKEGAVKAKDAAKDALQK
ncbi:MAG TPA: hypothetical protein VFW00_13755 [Rhodocyclaceae bacterium]|nr:hypothetical protein [Rhodocyclaceae bacterium]